MTSSIRKLATVGCLIVLCFASTPALASITRTLGPNHIFGEGRLFVKFDIAYDSVNNVYLVVWGTQAPGPVNGLFLNSSGLPISGVFAISEGTQQSGWARVVYSPQLGRFLVAYTKILAAGLHQRTVRQVLYAGGPSLPLPEVYINHWGGVAGSDAGIAYSPNAGRFFVTWWNQPGALPVSWMATFDPATNTATGPIMVSDPRDAESDPEIACDQTSNRCLVVGWSWGLLNGNLNTVWGRLIEASSGTPLGEAIMIHGSPLESEPIVTFSASAGRFVVAFVRNFSQVWSIPVGTDGSLGVAQAVAVSAGEGSIDGGGYGGGDGKIDIKGNPGTGTLLLATMTWNGYPAVQELDANGTPIAGAKDFIPNAGADYTQRSKETGVAVNAGAQQYLVIDNSRFVEGRSTLYAAGGSGPPPPPPPPPIIPNPRMFLDVPGPGALVQPEFAVAGWAVDLGSPTGTGVATIHVWAVPTTGAPPIFLGVPNMGVMRPDIAAYFGKAELAPSGFGLLASLPAGTYDVIAFAFSTVSGSFNNSHQSRITVVAPASNPKMFIDNPGPGQLVSSQFVVSGWAVDLGSQSGPGAAVVHAWAYPVSGAPPIFVGAALVDNYRPDVAQHFGNWRYHTAGYSLQGNLPPGSYHLVVFAFSTVTGSFNQAALHPIVVQ